MQETRYVVKNKKATFNYEVLSRFEAGMVLAGCEIKSLREGHASMPDAYCTFKKGELYIVGLTINPYSKSNKHFDQDPKRARKLLLKKAELNSLIGKVKEKGLTIAPISLYIKDNRLAKLEIGLMKGKKLYDKRETIAKRDSEREMRREMKRADYR